MNLNYTLYRHDRKDKRGGGVLVGVKSSLSSSLVSRDDNLELTWVCVHNSSVKLVFGVCYRPPDSNPLFCDHLRNSLTNVKDKFPEAPIFLFGDFNYPHINWSLLAVANQSPSNEPKQFLDLVLDFNLHQTITTPTRGDNVLDLLLTNCPDDVSSVTVLPGLSDHNLLHVALSMPIKRRSPTKKLITDYNRGNFELINKELTHYYENFEKSYEARSVNTNWELYKNMLLSLKKKYIPTITVKSDSNNPWFNKHLKSLLNRKKRLYRTAKSKNSPEAWERHRLCEAEYIKALNDAKDKYFQVDLISILRTNPNKFWRTISTKPQTNQINLVDASEEPIGVSDSAAALNEFFTSVFHDFNSCPIEPLPNFSPKTMPEIQITLDGITNLIRSLKISSSAGCDDINAKLLKGTIHISSKFLYLIFKQSLSTGTLPDDWKKAKIVPIFKGGRRDAPSNYRPISLTSVPCKLLEHIIASNLMFYLESINFFYPFQHGFRKSLSCETQLAEFTHDLLQHMDDNLQIDAIFLDFSKAFDRVSHKHLLAKLSPLGISPNIIKWLEQFLTGRVQFTCANNFQSALTNVTSGVPQGAGLSPLLFLIYVNDLPTNITSKLRLFADDCVLYNPLLSPNDTIALQHDLDTIAAWCEKWHMSLNLTKCKVMSFTRKHTTMNNIYCIHSVPIDHTSAYKYLGLHMTPSLSWVTHIQTIRCEASRTLGYLRRNLKSASSEIKKLAYLTYVRPKLEYASSIWHPFQAYLSDDLEAVQNRAARFIASEYSRRTSITALKQTLSLQPLASRRIISRLCLLHTFYFTRSGHALLKRPFRTSSRISHTHPLAAIKGRTTAMSSSFFPHTVTLWNALPDNIASCSDRTKFREKLTYISNPNDAT